jgi:hypothetical protein
MEQKTTVLGSFRGGLGVSSRFPPKAFSQIWSEIVAGCHGACTLEELLAGFLIERLSGLVHSRKEQILLTVERLDQVVWRGHEPTLLRFNTSYSYAYEFSTVAASHLLPFLPELAHHVFG